MHSLSGPEVSLFEFDLSRREDAVGWGRGGGGSLNNVFSTSRSPCFTADSIEFAQIRRNLFVRLGGGGHLKNFTQQKCFYSCCCTNNFLLVLLSFLILLGCRETYCCCYYVPYRYLASIIAISRVFLYFCGSGSTRVLDPDQDLSYNLLK